MSDWPAGLPSVWAKDNGTKKLSDTCGGNPISQDFVTLPRLVQQQIGIPACSRHVGQGSSLKKAARVSQNRVADVDWRISGQSAGTCRVGDDSFLDCNGIATRGSDHGALIYQSAGGVIPGVSGEINCSVGGDGAGSHKAELTSTIH